MKPAQSGLSLANSLIESYSTPVPLALTTADKKFQP